MKLQDVNLKFDNVAHARLLIELNAKVDALYYIVTKDLSEEEQAKVESIKHEEFAIGLVNLLEDEQLDSMSESDLLALKADIIAKQSGKKSTDKG